MPIASNAPETSDSEFTWKDFQQRCNSELLGKYGNLANRVLVFIRNQFGGVAPSIDKLEPVDEEFLKHIQEIASQAAESYEQFKLRKACHDFMELAHIGNVYFDSKRPWQDAKHEADRGRLRTTLACCLECLKHWLSYRFLSSLRQLSAFGKCLAIQMRWRKGDGRGF